MLNNMELNRKPTTEKMLLIDFLVNSSSLVLSSDWKDNLMVRNMNDGEMGSLQLYSSTKIVNGRKFGKQVSEFQFLDEDKVLVVASLNVDEDGNLLELDIWKTDFSKLIKLPHSYPKSQTILNP